MPSTINAKNTSTGVVITPDASGQLELQTADTTRMTIDVNGNVGIGTSSPGNALQVTRSSGEAIIGITNSGTASTWLAMSPGSAGAAYIHNTGNTSTVFTTNGTERMRIDSSGYVTNAVNGLGNGRVQAYQYYRLNSGLAGANVNTVQSMFGVGVTLVASTVYEFEIMVMLAKTAGTTSHSIGLSFGGTATINNIGYSVFCGFNTVATAGTSIHESIILVATNTTITAATTSAAVYVPAIIKGTVSINAGGTFIPQYTLSAAPGGAYTVQAGSYIKISPLSASGSNTSIGSWA